MLRPSDTRVHEQFLLRAGAGCNAKSALGSESYKDSDGREGAGGSSRTCGAKRRALPNSPQIRNKKVTSVRCKASSGLSAVP